MSHQFSIDGNLFEDGFSWIALTAPTDAAISSAITDKGHDCYVSLGSRDNHNTISGIVLGSKEVKHGKGKSYSLAALIYDVYKLDHGIDHFVFVREMGDDGLYYLEVKGGYIQEGDIIVPGPDKIHDIFAENAGDHFEIYIDSPNSDIIAGDYDYKPVLTEDLISEYGLSSRHIIKTPNDARIKLIKNITLGAVILAGVYGLYVGGSSLLDWWEERNKQADNTKSPAQLALEKRAKAEEIVGKRLKTQTAGYPAQGLAEACFESYLFQGGVYKIAGWELKSAVCNAGGLKTNFEQNNIYEISGDEIKARFSSQPDVSVSVSKNGQWLEKAELKVRKGFDQMQSGPGLFLEELPPAGQATTIVKSYLRTLYKTGFKVDDIKEVRESFPPEQEIPEELLYYEGRFTIDTPSLSQLEQITKSLNYEWVRLSTIEFADSGSKQASRGGSMPYKAKFKYYFK
jgi:hypothetical protein